MSELLLREHPLPTDAIVKQLYADAHHCAFPQCDKTLYATASDGVTRVLNSQVAHICARRQDGPRWSDSMSSAENRSASNLILLCRQHHAEIDELADTYPVDMLQEWRRDQVAQGNGYLITQAEVDEVKAASFTDLSTHVSGGQITFNLGGQGGNAPGAAGGGGGAMGGHATGGPGGAAAPNGGSALKIDLDGQPDSFPGGGGGGGGVISSGSISDVTEGDLAGFGFWDGSFDGQPGGTTSFGTPGSGVYLEAVGGSAPKRPTDDRLRVSSLLTADFARAQNGLITLVSGGPEIFYVLNLGDTCVTHLVVVYEAPGVPVGEYTVHLDVRSPLGTEERAGSLPLRITREGQVTRIPVTTTLTFPVTTFGRWTLSTSSDTSRLAEIDVAIRQTGTAPIEP